MWIANLSYWGFNQYIIQRALAAKSLAEAQKGVIFAAYLKLLMPVIIVLPGIAAVMLAPGLARPDEAYPTMMRLLPAGIAGLVFAALIAAIVASTASKINSVATIFTLDIYNKIGEPKSETRLVIVGRIAAVVAILLAILTARPLLGSFDQAFQYIQEYTGFFTPGIVVIFLLGLFWKRATEAGALAATIGSFVLSVADQDAVAGAAVHGPHGRGIRARAAARDRVFVVLARRRAGKPDPDGGYRLSHVCRLQHRRRGCHRDPDRALYGVVVAEAVALTRWRQNP